MTGEDGRRPLQSRQSSWARAAATQLAVGNVPPNRISQAGLAFAAIGALAFAASPHLSPGWRGMCLVAAAVMMQARLVCNLLDGMVAIEGGRRQADGPFWNEAPDRLSDTAFLVGAGYAAQDISLGWTAAALAILVAYLRELGRAEGFPPDYCGPMAKQHRMAVLTIGCLVAALWPSPGAILTLTLWIIVAGAAATAGRRSLRLIRRLKSR
ncbi:CDP-alcohol phosphatidyltransferase family protein [Neotabrizicola shimadae]|uniref:CDP-alcohol phosphatidyltransferase family protein n=2 Tax=Neotabrizicola shimadae TaxID=2807096 RepID=A0A8G0ZZB0_9RHOB|nr:CDP-alcohol phosphatidyltransferase family protein [Neotabrizicola shimadae]